NHFGNFGAGLLNELDGVGHGTDSFGSNFASDTDHGRALQVLLTKRCLGCVRKPGLGSKNKVREQEPT
ncbi:MAG: hypothetical protein OXD48_05235, partial [Litoreibacter sp.]|nr:hypothetical protein [Litoreibacter sp.]